MYTSSIDIKRANRRRLYRMLLANGKLSRQAIAAELSISLPTVGSILKELSAEGLVLEAGEMDSTGGRKAMAVSAVANARMAIGVDITRNHIGVVCVNLRGELLAHRRISKEFVCSAHFFQAVSEHIERFIADFELPAAPIIGAGVSIPGIVSDDGDAILDSHRLYISRQVKVDLSRYLPYDSRLFNDATAASLAETWNDGGQRNMVYISLSNSVGGAILINGRQIPGNSQRSGEFGHICVVPGGKPCYCGKLGHFDSYCSALALSEWQGETLEAFFEKLAAKDTHCAAVFDEYLDYLAIMIATLRMTFDCDIILGGYVGGFLGPYIKQLRPKVALHDTFQRRIDYIHPCRHKIETSAVGAALYYIESFISN